jgi:hypothetical protein
MSFFDAFTENRAELAFKRTQKNINDTWRYASKHPMEAAIVVGSLATLMILMPAPVLLLLAVSALALICFNLFNPETLCEQASSVLRYN